MTTQAQYDAATEAVLAEMRADIVRSVPSFLRSQLPDTTVSHYAGVFARLALDAAAAVPAVAVAPEEPPVAKPPAPAAPKLIATPPIPRPAPAKEVPANAAPKGQQ